MTETMWKVLRALIEARFGNSKYLSLWNLQEILGTELAGCGVPDGDTAIEKLVEMGLIEEVPDLGCRYRVVITDGEK